MSEQEFLSITKRLAMHEDKLNKRLDRQDADLNDLKIVIKKSNAILDEILQERAKAAAVQEYQSERHNKLLQYLLIAVTAMGGLGGIMEFLQILSRH